MESAAGFFLLIISNKFFMNSKIKDCAFAVQKRAMAVLLFLFVSVTAVLAADVDWGEIELGKSYKMEMFNCYVGTFKAEKTGVIVVFCSSADTPMPTVSSGSVEYVSQMEYVTGGRRYEFKAVEGLTYTFSAGVGIGILNEGEFYIKYIDENYPLAMTSANPAQDTEIKVSSSGRVTVEFNQTVTLKSHVAYAYHDGEQVASCTNPFFDISVTDGSYVVFGMRDVIDTWHGNNLVRKGDSIAIIYEVASNANPQSVLKDTITYKCPARLTKLVSVDNPITDFLSYWVEGDPNAVLSMTFDSDLFVPTDELVVTLNGVEYSGAYAQILFGDIESGFYYVETLPCAINGKTLSVDLSGKLRTMSTMVPGATEQYSVVSLVVKNVRNADGVHVESTEMGSVGSFSFAYNLKEITSEIITEFTPSTGSCLSDEVTAFELWISGYSDIEYSGVDFSYVGENGDTVSVHVAKDKLDVSVEDDEAVIMIPVPSEIRGKKDVTVSLADLKCRDGRSRNISVVYSFVDPTGIAGVNANSSLTGVYGINGVKVLDTVAKDNLKDLPTGIYIIGGKKVVVE